MQFILTIKDRSRRIDSILMHLYYIVIYAHNYYDVVYICIKDNKLQIVETILMTVRCNSSKYYYNHINIFIVYGRNDFNHLRKKKKMLFNSRFHKKIKDLNYSY